jgi:hypothetical protein
MNRHILHLVKFINTALGFMTCLYLITKSQGSFAFLLCLFITYINVTIDEILKRTD